MGDWEKPAPLYSHNVLLVCEAGEAGNITKTKLFSLPVEMKRTTAHFGGQSELAILKLQSSQETMIVQGS